jgi:hypothetical protein
MAEVKTKVKVERLRTSTNFKSLSPATCSGTDFSATTTPHFVFLPRTTIQGLMGASSRCRDWPSVGWDMMGGKPGLKAYQISVA